MVEETAGRGPVGNPRPDKGIPEEGVQPRGKWANNMEFILSMAGEIIGLGNVWRFPYLCYKNGGGVFLIPYFLFLFLCGIPLFFLETALGQYTSEGGVTAWRKICPMFEGVGIAAQVIVVYLNIYYIVILAWAILYLYNSFKNPLPWSTCENEWNTGSCHKPDPNLFKLNASWSFLNNVSMPDYSDNINYTEDPLIFLKTPEEEFWLHRVLRISDDFSMTSVHWDLALCLLIAWVLCYFCIFKGIKSTGKVVYFTATFPYLMLFILVIRGVTLPGAADGLKFYLSPDISKLADLKVWHDAGTQVLFSYAVCQGVLTSLGSYNKYNNNCYRDCLALCCLNSATSIFAGLAVFSVLGFMAHELNLDINEVATSGPGLAFIAYPKALAMMPGSSFWAVLFFLMILFLGLDSQFVCVESLATALTDLFPHYLRRRGGREILVLAIAVACFLLGLPLITEGGIYVFMLVDTYGTGGTSLFFIACFETIVVAWIYGADRFYDNIEDMIGFAPFRGMKYCWLLITPILCALIIWYDIIHAGVMSIYGYQFGAGALAVGSLIYITPLMCIPVFIFVTLCKNSDNMTTPSSDLRQARPNKPILTFCNRVVFRAQGQPNRRMDEAHEKVMMEEPSGV
ncbi:sodium- and chloride-dependent GABA transporter 2-like isoform X2 [Notolabrus celidotus]|nr:sodium- and chloride-dependent GABA transporter 2-like isoform X2 [Notolabrus celidotus]XP_034528869.1 sodium- and chloride-dependent GABA transporter 2-like isoform X2 [Notolabrus celidotus]